MLNSFLCAGNGHDRVGHAWAGRLADQQLLALPRQHCRRDNENEADAERGDAVELRPAEMIGRDIAGECDYEADQRGGILEQNKK